MKDFLFIDIETVPGQPHFSDLSAEWQSLWVDKISKTMPENIPDDSYHQRAGILAEFGKIVCIAVGYFTMSNDTPRKEIFKVKVVGADDERTVLLQWLDIVDKFYALYPSFRFVGHNIKEFDIPYICRRLVILGLPLPKYLQLSGMKPWETNLVDTLHQWRFGDVKHYISLNLLARVLNVQTPKDDINGSQVQMVFYEEKDLPRIMKYCAKDVVTVARIMQRFQNLVIVADEQVVVVE